MNAREGHAARMQNASTDTNFWDSFPTIGGCAVAICFAVAIGYGNSLDGPFILDDHGNIVGNDALDSFFPHPSQSRLGLRRPVGHISLAFNYRLGGMEVRGYHVFNVMVHLCAALVLFGLVRRTLSLRSITTGLKSKATVLAFAVSLIWAVHPLQTASVTYVIQRLESMMALFYLATMYCLVRGTTSTRRTWYSAAVLMFCLGVGTKEVIATAPLVLLLYDRTFLANSWRDAMRRRWGFYLALLPPLAWLVFLLSPAYDNPFPGETASSQSTVTSFQYLCSQPGVILHYLRLVFWPFGLCLDYAWPIAVSAAEILVPGLFVVVLLVTSLGLIKYWPVIGFLGTSFFLVLAPTSSVMPIKDLCFDHRMYLPLASVVTLTVLAVNQLVARFDPQNVQAAKPRGKRRRDRSQQNLAQHLPAFVLAVTAIGLTYLTVQRNRDYATVKSIWNDTVEKRPNNARAQINLGNAYLGEGQMDRALDAYSRAIEIAPDDPMGYNNRGRVYSERREYEKALQDYTRSIEVSPDYARALHNRGNVYMELRRYHMAIEDHTRALLSDPDSAETYFSRGNSRLQLGEIPLAIEDYNRALSLRPEFPDALVNRGSSYLKEKQFDKAIHDFTSAIALQPNLVAAYSNRALCHYFQKQYDDAWRDVRQVSGLGGQIDSRFLKGLEAASGGKR